MHKCKLKGNYFLSITIFNFNCLIYFQKKKYSRRDESMRENLRLFQIFRVELRFNWRFYHLLRKKREREKNRTAFFATFKRSRGVSSLGTIIVEDIVTMEKIEVERHRVSERSMNNFGVVDGRKAIDWNFHQPFARARPLDYLFTE